MTWYEKYSFVMGCLTLPVALAFIWMYSRDPWWRTWFGRSLMMIAVAIVFATVSSIMFRLYGFGYPGRSFMLIATSTLTFVAMLTRTIVLGKAQRVERRIRHEAENPH